MENPDRFKEYIEIYKNLLDQKKDLQKIYHMFYFKWEKKSKDSYCDYKKLEVI